MSFKRPNHAIAGKTALRADLSQKGSFLRGLLFRNVAVSILFFLWFADASKAEAVVTFFYRTVPLISPAPPGFHSEIRSPHAFLRIQGTVDGHPINEVFGFFPETKLGMLQSVFFSVPGAIFDNADSPGGRGSEHWNSSYPAVSVTIPDSSYHELRDYMNAWKADEAGYQLSARNCVNFADDVATFLGLNTPLVPYFLPNNYMKQLEDLNPGHVFTSKDINERNFRHPLTPTEIDQLRRKFQTQDRSDEITDASNAATDDFRNTSEQFTSVNSSRQLYVQNRSQAIEALRSQMISTASHANARISQQAPMTEAAQQAAIDNFKNSFAPGIPIGPTGATPAAITNATPNWDPNCFFSCFSTTVPAPRLTARSIAARTAHYPSAKKAALIYAYQRTSNLISGGAEQFTPAQRQQIPGHNWLAAPSLPHPQFFVTGPASSTGYGWRSGEKFILYLGHISKGPQARFSIITKNDPSDNYNVYYIKHSPNLTVFNNNISTPLQDKDRFNFPTEIYVQPNIDAADANSNTYIGFYDGNGALITTIFIAFDFHSSDHFSVEYTQTVATGFGKEYSGLYSMPFGPAPIGYQIASQNVWVSGVTDARECASWVKCYLTYAPETGYVFQFMGQGDDGGGGIIHDPKRWFLMTGHVSVVFSLEAIMPKWLEADVNASPQNSLQCSRNEDSGNCRQLGDRAIKCFCTNFMCVQTSINGSCTP